MKTKNYFLLLSFFITVFASCSSDNEDSLNIKKEQEKIRVVKLSDYLTQKTTRSSQPADEQTQPVFEDQQVLEFDDMYSAVETLENLSKMTDTERVEFFKELDFEGAYTLIQHADNKVDSLLDIEDEIQLENAAKDFKAANQSLIAFNPNDEYDLTPALTFDNDELELIGSKQGFVVVNNQLLSPEEFRVTASMFGIPAPIKLNFEAIPGAGSAVIKKGKYRSDISVGRDRTSGLFMYRCASQKKKWFWSARQVTEYWCDIHIENAYYKIVDLNRERRGRFERVFTPYLNTNSFSGRTIKCSIKNFTTGCCSGVYTSHDFTLKL